MLKNIRCVGNLLVLLSFSLSLHSVQGAPKKRKEHERSASSVLQRKQQKIVQAQVSQGPSYEKIVLERRKTRVAYIKQYFVDCNILPDVLVRIVADYACEEEQIQFVPYIPMCGRGYQRGKSCLRFLGEMQIIGVDKTGVFPLVSECYLAGSNDDESVDLPCVWGREIIENNLKNLFPQQKDENLNINRQISFICNPEPMVGWHVVHVLRALSKSGVSLVPRDHEGVAVGQATSAIFMIPNMSFRSLAQLWKNTVLYLRDVRSRSPNKKFKQTQFDGLEAYMDIIIEQYPRHEWWIEKILNNKDEMGEIVPIFYEGGTLKKCIEFARTFKPGD